MMELFIIMPIYNKKKKIFCFFFFWFNNEKHWPIGMGNYEILDIRA